VSRESEVQAALQEVAAAHPAVPVEHAEKTEVRQGRKVGRTADRKAARRQRLQDGGPNGGQVRDHRDAILLRKRTNARRGSEMLCTAGRKS
jgi:hypothetical protein